MSDSINTLQLSPPTEAERAVLLAQHAHRHPMPARIPVRGRRGESLHLTILLGNPSGACRMPPGARVLPVWSDMMASLYVRRGDRARPSHDALVQDCLLWPDLHVLNAWRAHWPGIVRDIALAAQTKYGDAADVFDARPDEAKAPAAIMEALAADVRAVYRILRPPTATLHVVIAPLALDAFDLFVDAVNRPDADHWALVRDLAATVTAAIHGAESIGLAIERWPAIASAIAGEVLEMAGAADKARLGEW